MVDLMTRYARRSDLLRRFEKLPKQGDIGRIAARTEVPYSPHRLLQRLDAETRAHLVRDYESGTPTTELTKIYSLSKASVLLLLQEAGVNMRRQGLNEEQTAEAVRLYGSGLSLVRVGERLGFGPSSVAAALRAAGITLRGRHDWLA